MLWSTVERFGETAGTSLGSREITLSIEQPTRIRIAAQPGTNIAQVILALGDEKPIRQVVTVQSNGLWCPDTGEALEWVVHPDQKAPKATIYFARAAAAQGDVELRGSVEVQHG